MPNSTHRVFPRRLPAESRQLNARSVIVPIRFIEYASGEPSSPWAPSMVDLPFPIVDVIFRYAPDSRQLAPNENPIPALIDTGANMSAATPRLIREMGCTATGDKNTTASLDHLQEKPSYNAHIVFPGTDTQVAFKVLPYDMPGRPYELLIGLNVLRRGALRLDYEKGIFEFEINPLITN